MKKDVLIIKNCFHEGPGLLADVLRERHIPFTVADLDIGSDFPDPASYGALVVFGCSESANDPCNKISLVSGRIRETLHAHIPYLGICPGFQMIIKVSGGNVVKSPIKETGLLDPNGDLFFEALAESEKKDPLFNGIKPRLYVFHLLVETDELTDEMTLLATGAFCKNQIAKKNANTNGM